MVENLDNVSLEAEKQLINYVLKTKAGNWGVEWETWKTEQCLHSQIQQ